LNHLTLIQGGGDEPPEPPAPRTLAEIKVQIATATSTPGLQLALEVAEKAIDDGHGEREALVLLVSTLTPPQDSRGA
jgi:hypothetical protein